RILTLDGERPGDELGGSVCGLADRGGHGAARIVVSARRWDDPLDLASGEVDHGRIYVVAGRKASLSATTQVLRTGQACSQDLYLDAGVEHGGRCYWIFGNFALSGSVPGVHLGPVNVPLNPDLWTQMTIDYANTAW